MSGPKPPPPSWAIVVGVLIILWAAGLFTYAVVRLVN